MKMARSHLLVTCSVMLMILWLIGTMQYFKYHNNCISTAMKERRNLLKPHMLRRAREEEELVVEMETEEELVKRKYHEHVKGMADVASLVAKKKGWQPQTYSQPYLDRERLQPCNVEAATRANEEGVRLVRVALEDKVFPPVMTSAQAAFRDSAILDYTCVAPQLNLIMILFAEAVALETPPAVSAQLIDEVGLTLNKIMPYVDSNAKYWWWRAMFQEVVCNCSDSASQNFYKKAAVLSPFLVTEHIHQERKYMNSVLSPVSKPADYFTRRALVRFHMYYEYMPYLGGFPKVTYADAHRFARDWHIAINNALPPYCFAVVARLYRFLVDENMLGWNGRGYRGAATHESLSDPLNSYINVHVKRFVEKLTNINVQPTYGYQAGYIEGDVLKPHTDRNACEFTLTTLIAAYPHVSSCPLFVQVTPWVINSEWVGRYEEGTVLYNDSINVQPQFNQWIIIRGRAKPHYRNALPKHTTCTTLLSHYTPL